MKKIFLLLLLSAIVNNVYCGPAPIVTDFKWGRIEVGPKNYKDCRLWPDHSESWDWKKTNTQHVPGIQIADLQDFIDKIDIIVLSEGVDGVLKIKPDTIEYIKKANKKLIIARTPKAIKKYNKLAAAGEKVGALLHSTC